MTDTTSTDTEQQSSYPPFFYIIERICHGSSPDYMAIRRIKCHGSFFRKRSNEECYVGSSERLIWSGLKFKEHKTYCMNYHYPKSQCFLTLDNAMNQFDVYVQEYLEVTHRIIQRLEKQIIETKKIIQEQQKDVERIAGLRQVLPLRHDRSDSVGLRQCSY